jgi:ferritin-like metal-binding protein YciE
MRVAINGYLNFIIKVYHCKRRIFQASSKVLSVIFMLMKIQNLEEAFMLKLQALYDIENEIVKALPKLIKAASSSDLKQAFMDHLEETKTQIERLEQIFEEREEKPKKLKVEAIRGLADDAKWGIDSAKPGPVRDALLIAAAQYVEHYEMAGYGSAVEWATLLGHSDAAVSLEETLEEEKMADEKLNDIATSMVNMSALGEEEEVE